MSFIIIYTTNPDIETAKKIASNLINKKLIACANYFPITSLFNWKGEINNEKEIVSILKTNKNNWEKVKKQIKETHPYKVPCIIKIEVESNSDFNKWINKNTKINKY